MVGRLEQRPEPNGEQVWAEQVHSHGGLVTLWCFGALAEQCTGIVHEDVDVVEASGDSLRKVSGLVEVGEVARLRVCSPTGNLDLSGHLLETPGIPTDRYHCHAQGAKESSRGASEARGGAGEHHGSPRPMDGLGERGQPASHDRSDSRETPDDAGLES